MQKLLLLLGLLICQACALEEFTIGFGEKEYCAVEGGSFEFCIVAVTGEASGNFSIIVERIYEQGSATGSNTIEISEGFGVGEEPICVTEFAVDNNCLDSGNTIELEIANDSLSAGVSVAEDCDSAEVEVFDDDVIRFDFSEDVFYATEGDSEVQVCINATWIEGPTKRAAPLLFYTEQQDSVVDLQKKIVLIPKGTEEGDMVCCPIAISEDLDVPDMETVDFQVHVNSDDLNVMAPEDNYVTVRVHPGVAPPVCVPMFENNTPMVTGASVMVDLSDCVTAALCTVGLAGTTVDCLTMNASIPRNSLQTLTVDVQSPVQVMLTRALRRDNGNCAAHLINEGFTVNGNSSTLEFEGTGPTAANPVTAFMCTVRDASDTVILDQLDVSCSSPFTFNLGTSASAFQVAVRPVDQAGCSRLFTIIFSFPIVQ